MAIKKELIDELIASSEGSLIGPNGLVKELTKALVERMLTGELNHHLGYEKHDVAGYHSGNSRNGKSTKTLKGEAGEMEIAVPRDRNGSFEPQLIEKHQTRFAGFDEKILSMYALGMTTRDIQGHLQDLYGVDVSAALISEVTDSVHGGSESVAGAAAGSALPDCVSGRADGEDAAGWQGGEPSGVHRDRDQSGGPEVGAGLVGQWERRRQVLDGGAAEPEKPWHEGCLRDLHRWAERFPGGHRSGISEHAGADLHCASDSRQSPVCELERA